MCSAHPTKAVSVCSNRKKAEQIRVQRKIEEAARGRGRGGGVRGGGGVVRGGSGGGRGGGGHQALVADVESLRRQEAEELSKLQSKNNPVSLPAFV